MSALPFVMLLQAGEGKASPFTMLVPMAASPAPTTAVSGVVLVNTTLADQKLTTSQHTLKVKSAYQETTDRFQFTAAQTPALPAMAPADPSPSRTAISSWAGWTPHASRSRSLQMLPM